MIPALKLSCRKLESPGPMAALRISSFVWYQVAELMKFYQMDIGALRKVQPACKKLAVWGISSSLRG
jgi:hypothetical protein